MKFLYMTRKTEGGGGFADLTVSRIDRHGYGMTEIKVDLQSLDECAPSLLVMLNVVKGYPF